MNIYIYLLCFTVSLCVELMYGWFGCPQEAKERAKVEKSLAREQKQQAFRRARGDYALSEMTVVIDAAVFAKVSELQHPCHLPSLRRLPHLR